MTLINFRRKYIFIYNHQTGCDNIYQYIKSNHNVCIKKYKNYIDIKKYLDSLNININDFYILGFIRNPVTRIASCYLSEYNQRLSNVKYLSLNSKDFNFYIIKELTLSFLGIEDVFFGHEKQFLSNVHIFKIEDLSKDWKIISSKLGLDGISVSLFSEDIYHQFNLSPKAALTLKKKYPLDWFFYFNPELINKIKST